MIEDRTGQVWEVPSEWGGESVIVLETRRIRDDTAHHKVFVLRAGKWTNMGDVTVFRETMFQDVKSIRIL